MIRYYDLGSGKRLNEIVVASSHDAASQAVPLMCGLRISISRARPRQECGC